eukprot:m.54917 g.54917  ORF g.54917 m.54917 type:complete len:309 (-) comp21991_c0_seq1:145-1071(-)
MNFVMSIETTLVRLRPTTTQELTNTNMSKRPEHAAPPEVFYNDEEARKYTINTRMIQIQYELTRRCMELINLPKDQPCYVLDIGCGSGLSGQELAEDGHIWVGTDISPSMLEVASEREVEGDLMQHDMGHGVCFRPGTFDGVISVSALQWLCNADKKSHVPAKRLARFFTTLYSSMARGARAAFQFYPETPAQMQLITNYAMKAGFCGGIVTDYPNSTRAKKTFLCLIAGAGGALPTPKTEGDSNLAQTEAAFTTMDRNNRHKKRGEKASYKSRDWIQQKKERRRKQIGNFDVRLDSKFTGRKRKPKF